MQRGPGERAETWLDESLLTTYQQFQPASGVETMSLTRSAPPARVRHQARDAVALMAFSASSSMAVAAGLLLLAQLAQLGR